MAWQATPYTIPLLVAAALSVMSSFHVALRQWMRHSLPGAPAATILLLASAVWTAGHGLEFASADLASKILWSKVQYLGIVTVPTAWLVFMLQYSGRARWVSPRSLLLLSLAPTVVLLLVFTNESHRLIWSRVGIELDGQYTALVLDHGPAFWAYILYSYLLLAIVTFLLVQMLWRSRKLYRWQASVLLVVAALPWVANIVYVLGLSPFPHLDLTSLAFTAASVTLAWVLTSLRVGEMVSVSHSTAVQIMRDGVLVLDGQGRIVFMNPAAEKMVGKKTSQVRGQFVQEVWQDWPDVDPDTTDALDLEQELTLEEDEDPHTYDLRLSLQRDWRGQLVNQVAVIRDITGRKRTEEKREEYIRDLGFLSHTATELVDLPADEDLYQFIGGQLHALLHHPYVLVNSYDAASDSMIVRAVVGSGVQLDVVGKLMRRKIIGSAYRLDDEARESLAAGKLVEVPGGVYGLTFGHVPRAVAWAIESLLQIEHIYSMGFARKGELLGDFVIIVCKGGEIPNPSVVETFAKQVSVALQRKQAEEARRESEERFRRLAEHAQDAIFRYELAPRSGFSYVNGSVRTLGYSPEEFYENGEGMIRRLVHPDDLHLMSSILAGQGRSGPAVVRWLHRDGGVVWTELRCVLLRDEAGEVVAIEGIARDITERKQLEEQLLRAQRLETAGRIAGQVAHDFNNLLSPLVAYPELMKMELPEGHPALGFCDDMLEAAQQMAAINEDMMALGRRGHFDRQPFDLNQLVQQVVDQQTTVPELAVRTELSADLLPCSGSPAQMLRVVTNLVSNAREAMQDSGTLTVQTENLYVEQPCGSVCHVPPGEYVRLTVTDTGSGIPPEIQSRIFDPFFSTKSKAKRRGCGLGLSIVQAIVEDHQGHLDLESEVGRGSSFMLYLPIARDISVAGEQPQEVRGGTEAVLVVDDDQLQREAGGALLKSMGYRVFTAASGEEAVEYCRRAEVDLLLLDMIMPGGMDGAETFRRVREVRPRQKAIILSGFAESDRVELARELGAGGYLRKPVTREKLALAVREALDRE